MPEYLAALAAAPGGDIVFRLLTSQPHGRLQNPRCHHGDPYPSFYLGVLGGPLRKDSWLYLRGSEDYDGRQFGDDQAAGILTWVAQIPESMLRALLECAAAAPDTTVAQERAIRDQLALASRRIYIRLPR
jgi:hypothetical protein